MIKHSEMNARTARERVEKAETTAEAAQYLYKEVGWGAIQALSKAVDLRLRENSDITMKWCVRLAERLRGNSVA